MPSDSKLRPYYRSYHNEIRAKFERVKHLNTDSDVKGGANEQIIADLLTDQFFGRPLSMNSSITDTNGNQSSEVDLCVCNGYQPIMPSQGQLLIVEGVDLVVQIKAKLSSSEIERSLKNAKSVRKLKRHIPGHATMWTGHGAMEGEKSYISTLAPPYIVVTWSSELTLSTVAERCVSNGVNLDWNMQPDGYFILDRGIVVSTVSPKEGKNDVIWTTFKTGEDTLMELIRFARKIPKINYNDSEPILRYFPKSEYEHQSFRVEKKSD